MWRNLSLKYLDYRGRLRPVSAAIIQKEDFFLIVKKPRKDHAWQFPQGGQEPQESRLEAAQRELKEECGTDLVIKWNTKCLGKYAYKFPSYFQRSRFLGAQVSFFSGEYVSGEIKLNPEELCDFRWEKKSEFKNYFTDTGYRSIIDSFFHEKH